MVAKWWCIFKCSRNHFEWIWTREVILLYVSNRKHGVCTVFWNDIRICSCLIKAPKDFPIFHLVSYWCQCQQSDTKPQLCFIKDSQHLFDLLIQIWANFCLCLCFWVSRGLILVKGVWPVVSSGIRGQPVIISSFWYFYFQYASDCMSRKI